MQVVIRNFIKLLSAGAFHTNDEIEDMSEFKWNQLLYIAKINKVDDFVTSGIVFYENSSNINLPLPIEKLIDKRILNTNFDTVSQNYIYKQSKTAIKKFSNSFLNKRLNKIIYNEIHCIDTSIDSLTFLTRSIDNINNLLASNFYIRDLIEFGLYLRNNGNKIDFLKIDNWLSILKMKKIMNLVGYYLISYFKFDTEEIPFYHESKRPIKMKLPLNTIPQAEEPAEENPKGQNILIYNIPKPNTGMFRYITYYPLETFSIFFTNIFKSLSNIEE